MAERKNVDSGEAEVQAKVDEVEDKGYFGTAVDERPREDYTVAGVIRRANEGK
jgi:hypothetical protein